MKMYFHKYNKSPACILLMILGMSCPQAAETKLNATVANATGRCLMESAWVDVVGRYIYWEISGPRVASRWHESNLIRPKNPTLDIPVDSSRLRAPFAFAIELKNFSPKTNGQKPVWPELVYRDKMRVKLGKPSLVAATIVHLVNERELWEHNRTNHREIFSNSLDATHYVPTGYSVCDLELVYLMKNSEAIFEKPLFGRIVFKTNKTVPLENGQRTLAEEILDRKN
jgi:hypothetical protein